MQLIRVTGMDGAEAYQMPPNSVVPLFDADNDIVYVKSTDVAGFPAIRAFAFQPIENPTPQARRHVAREEFNDTLAKLKEAIGNGKQPVRERRETASKQPIPSGHGRCPKEYGAIVAKIRSLHEAT